MDEFSTRQVSLIRALIGDFRKGRLTLNSFIQKIDGLYHVIENKRWKEEIFPVILDLEQVNAFALDAKTALTARDHVDIEQSLQRLEAAVSRFESP